MVKAIAYYWLTALRDDPTGEFRRFKMCLTMVVPPTINLKQQVTRLAAYQPGELPNISQPMVNPTQVSDQPNHTAIYDNFQEVPSNQTFWTA